VSDKIFEPFPLRVRVANEIWMTPGRVCSKEWYAEVSRRITTIVLEAAAAVVDECNREGPYNAIGAADRIRALIKD
jgi:hypothetical protein